MKYRDLLPLFLTAMVLRGTTPPAAGQDPKQHIDVGKLPEQATLVEDVIVPVPSEVFGVLDKLGTPDWHGVLRTDKSPVPGARAETALLLGDVIAEGFI